MPYAMGRAIDLKVSDVYLYADEIGWIDPVLQGTPEEAQASFESYMEQVSMDRDYQLFVDRYSVLAEFVYKRIREYREHGMTFDEINMKLRVELDKIVNKDPDGPRVINTLVYKASDRNLKIVFAISSGVIDGRKIDGISYTINDGDVYPYTKGELKNLNGDKVTIYSSDYRWY